MKCKKAIMGYAALLILLFHFYIPFGKSSFEIFMYRSAYIGVDLFFFVSAMSLGSRKDFKVLPFYLNRICSTYLPFVVLAVIGAVYKKWTFTKFFEVICGKELFQRGGGAFLWFLPGIMIFYLFTPLIYKLKKKFGLITLPLLLLVWAGLAFGLQYGLKYTAIFILLNRLPIFLLGFYYDSWHKIDLKKFRLPVIVIGLAVGIFLVFKFGTTVRLMKPLKDLYYVIAIPLCLSIVELFDYVCSKLPFKLLPLDFVGGITLELYGLQMIFGYDLENYLYKTVTKTGILVFLLTAIILIAMAYIFHLCRVGVNKTTKFIKNKIKENSKK